MNKSYHLFMITTNQQMCGHIPSYFGQIFYYKSTVIRKANQAFLFIFVVDNLISCIINNCAMSAYTFALPEEVYRWMVSDHVLPNKGEINEKAQVILPTELNNQFENGIFIAKIIALLLTKSQQPPSLHLEGVKNQNSKAVRATNWNFIWLCFDDLRMQFDLRIKNLILQGESALITQIVKQLYDRDEHRDEKGMKSVTINQKAKTGGQSNVKNNPLKSNTLDIKKINLQKNPDDSESSLQFLILLLSSSFGMSVEEILGLFTNQNKYLAHLIVKGMNDNFEGVVLFYSLLQKHIRKLKYFCDNDPRDGESCLYAIKPGMISKSRKAAEMTIDILNSMKNVYPWFTSESGRGSTTLFLGVKRHPELASQYWNLLLKIVQGEEAEFFTHHFKKCFRDAEQLVQICDSLIYPISGSFMKDRLLEMGMLTQWIGLGINLFDKGTIDQKLLSFRFVGSVMSYMPDLIEQNEDYLVNFKKGWRERPLIEFVFLFDELLVILEDLAGEKNTMARKVYQIIIQILDAVYNNDDKREYLVTNFITVLPKFPKIPTQYLIQIYKEGTLKTSDLSLVNFAINLSKDVDCLTRIAETLLKIFNSQAVLNCFLANILYNICRNIFSDDSGKLLTMKVIKECLNQHVQLESSRKIPQLAKYQPMYFAQKGNDRYSKEDEDQFVIAEQCSKNIMSLVQKLSDLLLGSGLTSLGAAVKEELMETNAIIKKGHYKTASKYIMNILTKKFGVTREQEQQYNQDFRVKKSLVSIQESMARKKMSNSISVMPMSSSRFGGPDHLRKQFGDVTQKRKREQEERRLQQQKKQREEVLKKLMVKKELQKTNLLRGFAQQAELKEDGFWSKFNKENKQEMELYPPELMEARDVEYIESLFKKYHRVLRTLFFKYTNSMYTVKSINNFEDNKDHKQALSVVELIQFLKEFKLLFLTSKEEVQNLVRDLNVKMLNKRESLDLDFSGFQQFVIQFCAIIYTKTHTINANTNKGMETMKKCLGHLSHLQLVQEWFGYLKMVFIEKGEKTVLFDEPEAAYFNQTEVIKEFTRQIQLDPTFILPEGYKKVTEKVYKLTPKLSTNNLQIKASLLDVLSVLDQIIFQSELGFHIIEPMMEKQTKIRVKPNAFVNVKAKLLEASESKVRALSSIIDKKPVIPPIKMLERRQLSFGMKLGLSYVGYKDKLLGEQVAYVVDDMITAVENGRNTIEKEKIVNEILKRKQELMQKQKFTEIERQKKRLERKGELQKMKKDITQKKQKQAEQTKQERQRKKQKELSRQKKIKEEKEKYLQEQKNKVKEKKKQEQSEEAKKKQEEKHKKQEKKKTEEQFKTFNLKQIQKFKKQLDEEAVKKKKQNDKEEEERKRKHELVNKLRKKIHDSDKKAIELKQKTNEEIADLYNSGAIQQIYKQFSSSLRALFDFLLKSSYLSITEKKNNSEIIFQTWHYFNLIFQLNPLIINAKELTKIFRYFTKEKQVHKDYEIGLNFDQFSQALLRVAIKHKSIFNKLSEKIKENMSAGEIDALVQKDIEQKQKNEFEEPKAIDVRNLIKEEDVIKSANDHYGDISKVNEKTLKGLIYYLKIPKDKQGQEKRFRQIGASKISYSLSKIQQLRQKLNDEYSLPVPVKKRKTEANQSQIIKNSSQMDLSQLPP